MEPPTGFELLNMSLSSTQSTRDPKQEDIPSLQILYQWARNSIVARKLGGYMQKIRKMDP
ncbi:hypothetical protein ACLOJK_005042 [Asimina triloba]